MKKKSSKKTKAQLQTQEKKASKNKWTKIIGICLMAVLVLFVAFEVSGKVYMSGMDMAGAFIKSGGDDIMPDGMYIFDNKTNSVFEFSLGNGCGFDLVTDVVASGSNNLFCTATYNGKPVIMKVNNSDVMGMVELPGKAACIGIFDESALVTVSDGEQAGKLLLADFENGSYTELVGNVAAAQSGKQFVTYGNTAVYKDSAENAYMYYSDGKTSSLKIPESLEEAQLCSMRENEAVFVKDGKLYGVNILNGKSDKIVSLKKDFKSFCCIDSSGRYAIATSYDNANELLRTYIYDLKTGISVEIKELVKYDPSVASWFETKEGLLSSLGVGSN